MVPKASTSSLSPIRHLLKSLLYFSSPFIDSPASLGRATVTGRDQGPQEPLKEIPSGWLRSWSQ